MTDKLTPEQLGLPAVIDFSVADEMTKPWDIVQSALRDKEFIIIDYTRVEAFNAPGFVCTVLVDGKQLKALINGEVLMKSIEQIEEHLPVKVKMIKKKSYYEFS